MVYYRDEFIEGTTNRLVTITGTPAATQAAHVFITKRLEVGTRLYIFCVLLII
jgi:hypothetical protein